MNHEGIVNPALQRFLCSNAAPNACEAVCFQLQADNITSQISQLHSRLAELEDQLRPYRSVLSPLRKMPAEILGEIFLFFLPDHLELDARDRLINIQLVCKSWRDAARLTHRLWSALSFQELTDPPAKKVKQWLTRAGSIPKSLVLPGPSYTTRHVCTDQAFCGPNPRALKTLLTNLEGTLDHLSLAYNGPRCFQKLLDSFGEAEEGSASFHHRPCQWDSLKVFTLKFRHEWNEPTHRLRSMFLQLPPNITSFELYLPSEWSDVFIHSEDSIGERLPLPRNLFGRLTCFTLGCDWDGTQWLEDALGQCVNLETLTIDFSGMPWSSNYEQPDTERLRAGALLLSKVQTLRLKNAHPGSTDILNAMKAPRLVELGIEFQTDDEDTDWSFSDILLSFVERSKCEATLRFFYLRFAWSNVKAQELAATLRQLPFLTHLTLQDVTWDSLDRDEDIFEQLLKQPEGLPNLEVLELLDLQPDFEIFNLLSFLRCRRPFRMNNGEPVFTGPDTLKRLKMTYKQVDKKYQIFGQSQIVKILRKWGGVSFDIGPIVYVDY
ncbi:hypothetical protein MD484_g6268, partial [Candolleomyces efflorescens]